MQQEAADVEGTVERRVLMQRAGRQALGEQRRGGDGAGRHQRGRAGARDALDERQQGDRLADACAVQPDQPAGRTGEAGEAAALVEPVRVLLAAPEAQRQERRGERRAERRQGAIEMQRKGRVMPLSDARPDRSRRPWRRRACAPRRDPAARRVAPSPSPRRRRRGNPHGISHDDGGAAERQAERGAVPGVELDAPARHHRGRDDRPAGELRQGDDPEAADAGALRHVGGHRHRCAGFELAQKLAHRRNAALVVGAVGRTAGAAHRRHAEIFERRRLRAGVLVPGDERGEAVDGVGPGERDHQMLAVPHRADDRRLPGDRLVDVLGNRGEPTGDLDEAQIFGEQEPDGFLPEPRPADASCHRTLRRSAWAGGARARSGGAGGR